MTKTIGLMLAGALLAAPVAAQAQTPDAPAHRGPHPGMMRGHGGLAAMLQRHAELELTAEQVARLEAIERDLRARNEPLRQQIAALMPERAQRMERGERPRVGDEQRRQMREQRGERVQQRRRMTEEQRQQMRARMEQARPVLEQMRANTRTALEQARAVLTDAQRAQLEQRRNEMRERRGGERGGMRGMPGRDRAPRNR